MRALITAVVCTAVLAGCGGGADGASPGGASGAAPSSSDLTAHLPAPTGAPQVTDADTTACYLGYLTIQTYWDGLVKAAKSGEPLVLSAKNATGLKALLAKPSSIRPDDANVADSAIALRKSARGLAASSVSAEQARTIGKNLVALRKACTLLGMDQEWFATTQDG